MTQKIEAAKHLADATAAALAFGALAEILPPFAAFLSIVWLVIQIYDRVKYGPRKYR